MQEWLWWAHTPAPLTRLVAASRIICPTVLDSVNLWIIRVRWSLVLRPVQRRAGRMSPNA